MSAALAIVRDPDAAASLLSPIRMRVLRELRQPGSATQVAHALGLPRQKVNYHVRALEDAGLVEHVTDQRKGNCVERIVRATATRYLISPSVVGELAADPDAVADRMSSSHLAALCARTVSELAELRDGAERAGKRLPTLSLEAAIRFATPADQAAFAEELGNAVAALVARYHDADAPAGRWYRLLAGVHPSTAAPQSPDSPSEIP